jgi:hypothetical protein
MWSVGRSNAATGSAPDRNLTEHWNGSAWTVVSTPSYGGGFNDLTGVAANDSNDVWAVGNWSNGTAFYTLAEHWNGSSWAGVTTPQPSSTVQALGGISALSSSNMYSAGFYLDNTTHLERTLILHWDGSAWSMVTTPNLGAGDNILQTVTARAANDVWAVGNYRVLAGIGSPTNNPWQTLIEHYDGSTWTAVTGTNPVSGDNVLFNVSASSATEAWAAGYTDNSGLAGGQKTLTEHWNGTAWSTVASTNIAGTGDNMLIGVLSLSPTNAWATGFGKVDTANTTGGTALAEHWDGTTWTTETAESPGGNFGNAIEGLAALPGNDVWGVGDYFTGSTINTLTEQFQLPAPTIVTATPGDNTATITWTAPACDGGFAITGYNVTASDGCTVQSVTPTGSTATTFTPFAGTYTNGTPITFSVEAVSASLGAETASAQSPVVTPTGPTAVNAYTACSPRQYQYPNPDPTNFVDIDSTNLKLTVTPSVASYAVISGNADLWTANAGLNQDIGINVSGGTFSSGTVVGWKESGGFAGTFSPNAAQVQSVVSLAASTAYTIKLQWKSNKAIAGATIFAGAGPLPGGGAKISPTRLAVHLVPVSAATEFTVSTNKQYSLAGNNGATWADMDTGGLLATPPITAGVDSIAVITGNSDLWTANAGFNQDIGLSVTGTGFPTVAGQPEAWKESGGFAGTFSPNAAFVQAFVPFTVASGAHTVKLQWKANKPAGTATIYAGAGPFPAGSTTFSPTRLSVLLLPTADVAPTLSTKQYTLPNSDGAGWTPIDSTVLQHTFAPGVILYTYKFAGNVDLFTQNAGFNQDVGIFISGGQYGSGTLVAWKESGGFAGTFSPNAAYVETVQRLTGGTTYTFWLAWKTNQQAPGATIFAGAGPLPAGSTTFSPTSLTAYELSSP